ncbi:MAG: cupin-like domain-containing protein [Microcystis panniformis]
MKNKRASRSEIQPTYSGDVVTISQPWTIVCQVKTYRVVYFTDDEEYVPTVEGNSYYVSLYVGELPKEMTLRNCSYWLFNGFSFVEGGHIQLKSTPEDLLEYNRNALIAILREKIGSLQKPYCSSSVLGYLARERKLAEAQQLISNEDSETDYPYLMQAAAKQRLTVRKMAKLILAKKTEFETMLIRTECLRERFTWAIKTAISSADLVAVHQRLQEELTLDIKTDFVVELREIKPQEEAEITEPTELNRERTRLEIQLCDRINNLRRTLISGYLLDDIVFQYIHRLAQAVVSANRNFEQILNELDIMPLLDYAVIHEQTFLEAAEFFLDEVEPRTKVLLETEQMKDSMRSRIANIQSFQDLETTSNIIKSLRLSSDGLGNTDLKVSKKPSAVIIPAKRDTKTLKLRREAVQRAANNIPSIADVPRVRLLDPPTFRALAQQGLPFVIEGLVSNWPIAVLKPKSLKNFFGELRVKVRVGDYVQKAFSPERTILEMSLAEYFELLQKDAELIPPYLGNQKLPKLTALCQWPDYYQQYDKPRIWLGPAGTITPLHCDYDDNLFVQVFGEKRFVIYSPNDYELLDPKEINPVLYGSSFDPDSPDYENFPLARDAHFIECIVKPGEMLFLPAGWFHQVKSLTFSLSVNRWAHDPPMALFKSQKKLLNK